MFFLFQVFQSTSSFAPHFSFISFSLFCGFLCCYAVCVYIAGLSTPMTSASVASPFFLSHPHSHDAAIRLAAMAARRHHHLPNILHPLQTTRKGGQIRFTHRQSHHLEETFNSTRYLTPGQRRTLANRLSLTERQV